MLSLVIAMAACAAPGTGPDPDVTRFDGVYRGTQSTDATGPGATGTTCAASIEPVRFRVSDGHIWNHRHGRHRRMDGVVDAQGRITMQDEGGDRQLSGMILDGRITASETTAPGPDKSSPLMANEALSCLSRIEATRSAILEAGPDR